MTEPTALPSLSGPKILLEGPSGTGKSYSIGTLVEWAAAHQHEVYVLYTENSLETLLGYFADKGKPVPDCLHWHVSTIEAIPMASLIQAAKDAGMLSYESLTKSLDPDRAKNNPWEKFLTLLTKLPDDRTGREFGNISNLTNKQIFVIDSLTEAANACFRMRTGNKPVVGPNEYQVAQNNFLSWIRFMCQSLKCTFVMTGHVQRQVNEVTGTTMLMTEVIGKALGDQMPRQFSEVILTRQEGAAWYWSVATPGVDTKTRYLPISDKNPPDFGPLMNKWLKRGAV